MVLLRPISGSIAPLRWPISSSWQQTLDAGLEGQIRCRTWISAIRTLFYGLDRYVFVNISSRNEARAVILITPKSSIEWILVSDGH